MTEAFFKLTNVKTPSHFFSRDRESRFSLLDGSRAELATILTRNDVDCFLSHRAISYPFVRVVNEGREIPLSKYLKQPPDAEFRLLDPDRVLAFYLDGATIVLQKAHLWLDRLHEFQADFERSMCSPVNCNVYVTPAHSKAFEPHFDTHDVFVLQVDGEKTWNLYDAPRVLPLDVDSLTRTQSRDYLHRVPAAQIPLRPGDVLHIPRGLVHDAFTESADSIHATFAVFPPRGVDVFKSLQETAMEAPFFRRALPSFAGPETTSPGVAAQFASECQSLLEGITDEFLIQDREIRFLGVPSQDIRGRFDDLRLVGSIRANTLLTRRVGIAIRLSHPPDGRIGVSFYNKTIMFPNYVQRSLEFICSQNSFRVHDVPGGLADDAKIVLVRKLVREGLLAIGEL